MILTIFLNLQNMNHLVEIFLEVLTKIKVRRSFVVTAFIFNLLHGMKNGSYPFVRGDLSAALQATCKI